MSVSAFLVQMAEHALMRLMHIHVTVDQDGLVPTAQSVRHIRLGYLLKALDTW